LVLAVAERALQVTVVLLQELLLVMAVLVVAAVVEQEALALAAQEFFTFSIRMKLL